MLEKRSCPNCNESINKHKISLISLRSPLLECTECDGFVQVKNANEWLLMDKTDKMVFSLVHIYLITLLGINTSIFALILTKFNIGLPMMIGSIFVIAASVYYLLSIEVSKKRFKNRNYLDALYSVNMISEDKYNYHINALNN